MTIGDIVEKVSGAFGSEPRKVRDLRARISSIAEKIRCMEDDLKMIRKQVTALEERVADLKRDLQQEKSGHNQDLIMDDIERLDKEFVRLRDLAKLKGVNVDAAQTLHAKLNQLLENAVNGSNTAELEDILGKVECMDDDLSDVRKLVDELDRPTSASIAGRRAECASKEGGEAEARAARMARILGKDSPAAKPVVGVTPAAAAAPTSTPAAPSTPDEKPGVAVPN